MPSEDISIGLIHYVWALYEGIYGVRPSSVLALPEM